MADSPDGTQDAEPSLRIGGWLPPARQGGAPPSYPPAVHDGRHRAEATLGPAMPPPHPGHGLADTPGGPARSLVLAGVAVAAVATLAFALSPFWSSRQPVDAAAPAAPAVGAADPAVSEPPSTPPTWTFSPAPASLSTRAALPTRAAPAPTRRPARTPGGTTTGPRPSTSPPKPPAEQRRPDELPPLPPSEESELRSSGGGRETFVDFVNARDAQVVVHWLDYGGHRQRYAVLQPGQAYRQHTYVGHPWVVTDAGGDGLACFLPAAETRKAVVR